MTEAEVENSSADDLFRRRLELVEQLSAVNMELEQRRQEGRLHVRPGEVPWKDQRSLISSLTVSQRLKPLVSPELGFDAHTLWAFMIETPPGMSGGQYHVHGEAVKYYLQGRGIEHVGDRQIEVEAGDVVLIPANEWHGTENPYDEPIIVYAVEQVAGTYHPKPIHYASADPTE